MNAQTPVKAKAVPKEPDTLRIWNALSKTDPKHTKPFSRAGGFKGTAVKPIWIVKMLTEHFGPCGVGWGIGEPQFQVVPCDGETLVYCTVQCWHNNGTLGANPVATLYGVGGDKVMAKRSSGPFCDDEAFKKAFTDAVGNAFKFIGVSADIHMGQFDDSKYLAEVAKEFEAANEGKTSDCTPKEQEGDLAPTALKASLKLLVHNVNGCGDLGELIALLATEDALSVMEQAERRAPGWWETGEGMPAEFTPIKKIIENRRKEMELAEEAISHIRAG